MMDISPEPEPKAGPATPPTFVARDFETADYGRRLELRYSDRTQRQNAVRQHCAIRSAHRKPHLRDRIVHTDLQHVSPGWDVRQAVRIHDALARLPPHSLRRPLQPRLHVASRSARRRNFKTDRIETR